MEKILERICNQLLLNMLIILKFIHFYCMKIEYLLLKDY